MIDSRFRRSWRQRRKRLLRDDLHQPHRLTDALHLHRSAPLEPQPFHPPRQMNGALARQYLAGLGDRAESSCQIQGAAPIATLGRHSLTRIQPHPHTKRECLALVVGCAEASL